MRFKLSLLFVFALACFAAAGPFSDLDRRLKHASPKAIETEVRQSGLDESDKGLAELLDASARTDAQKAKSIKAYVSMRALFESGREGASDTPIASIKRSGLYRKAADEGGGNWVQRAIERIRFNVPDFKPRHMATPGRIEGFGFLIYVVWGILALLVCALLFFAIRYFHWQAIRKAGTKRSMAMLEDDEPERSLDEWLELAASLESERRYREAVRCLYVACLLRYDEHRVARFDRTQTNWEHFARIQASPSNPTEFDFQAPTSEFDHIWYGMRPTGAAEVERFRASYKSLTDLLSRRLVGAR